MCRLSRLLLITLGLFTFVPLARAQAPTPSDDDVNRVAKQLYCPECENVPLDVCPTQACADWRADIRDKLAQGWSDEAIRAYFAQQHGDRVLARPPARGLNLLVYLVPPLSVLLGAALIYGVLRSSRRINPAPGESRVPPRADDYTARLEEELKERY